MEKSHRTISLESVHDNPHLKYFTEIFDDEKIGRLLKQGEITTRFSFYGVTNHEINTLLPHNFIDDNGYPATVYLANGSIREGSETHFHLALQPADGETTNTLIIEGDAANNLCMYDKDSDYITPLSPDTFGKLSLEAANLNLHSAPREHKNDSSTAIFLDQQTVYDYWNHLAIERQGVSETVFEYITEPTSIDDQKSEEVRLLRIVTELPLETRDKITIEHATQLHDLDAEIVYRLELEFKTSQNHQQEMAAEKRIVSGCERQLISARLSSKNSTGHVTPLDIQDETTLAQFRITIESLLQDVI